MKILSVFDKEFKKYGQVLEGYDFSELFSVLEKFPVSKTGVEYVPSVKELEECSVFAEMRDRGFGGMPIQLGICSGTNNTLNCLEYHKNSEFNIAKDDICLILGLQTDIEDGKYDTSKTQVFHVPAGVGVELYATTLHYAPCGYEPQNSYQVICTLPAGTNYAKPHDAQITAEDKMCRGSNKWLMAHKDSPEASEGAYVGLVGENIIYTK